MNVGRLCHPPLCVLFALGLPVVAQEARVEQARQFQNLGEPRRIETSQAATSAVTSVEGTDPESFGIQQMLREAEESPKSFRAFAEISAFVTNNVALTRRNTVADSFLVATFGFESRHPLPKGFQWETSLRLSTLRYDEFRQLDFNSIDLGTGVNYHSGILGGIDLYARYNFNALLTVNTNDTFFQNHTITAGVQKLVPFSQAHYGFFGASGQVGFADPKESERSELAAYAGYHLAVTRQMETDLLYRYGYYIYSLGSREDHNHTLSLGLRYRFTDWFSAAGTSYFVWGRSNREVFNYDAGTAGGALTFSLQF